MKSFDRAKAISLPFLTGLALFAGAASAGNFSVATGPALSDDDRRVLEDAGQVLVIDGEKHYLIGDVAYRVAEIEAQAFAGQRWPGGNLIYRFAGSVANNAAWQSRFRDACALWSDRVPNVRCIERSTETTYLEVHSHSDRKCVSYATSIGMRPGGSQRISIYHDPQFDPRNPTDGCLGSHWNFLDVIAHEIGHTLGLLHEQSRWDRDSYVKVLYQNLERPTDAFQFRKVPATRSTTFTPYDFQSIMHYGDNFFAKPGTRTLVPSECYEGDVPSMGSWRPTESDVLELRHHYGLPIWDLIKRRRDPSCGVTRVNAAERKHFCVDLAENCGSGMNRVSYSGVTTHSTWWCPGGFDSRCAGETGNHRSCCPVTGKTPFDVKHRRGSRSCQVLREKHHSNWRCGCAYYEINSVCPTLALEFDTERVREYMNSDDLQLKTIGTFFAHIDAMRDASLLHPDALNGFENHLIDGLGAAHYLKGMTDAQAELVRRAESDQISASNPLSGPALIDIWTHAMRIAADEFRD